VGVGGVEQCHGGGAEEVPSAGHAGGVDRGASSGDSDTAGGYLLAGGGVPGQPGPQVLVGSFGGEVREPGGEPDRVDPPQGAGVSGGEFDRGEVHGGGCVGEVVAVVGDGDYVMGDGARSSGWGGGRWRGWGWGVE